MSDRAPPPSNTRTRAIGTNGIRRTLFAAPMSRRPTSSSTASTISAESRSNSHGATTDEQTVRAGSVASTGSVASQKGFGNVLEVSPPRELVVRDKNGDVYLPEFFVDDEEDLELQEKSEKDKERQKLREAVKHYQMTRSIGTAQPDDELLGEVRATLRCRVAALEDDEWMFGPTKVQQSQM